MSTTPRSPSLEKALERWEDDGGRDAGGGDTAPRAWLPTLPPGYFAQPEGVFFDPTGRVSYEFNRVYRPAARTPDSTTAAFVVLDEALSFWSSSWSLDAPRGGTRNAGRWLTFARATRQMTPPPSFASFSTMTKMRTPIEALLGPP
jgi:hypothetical protein